MDVDPASPMIYDEFTTSFLNTDYNLDDFDEILTKTETLNYLNDYDNYENTIYDKNYNNIPTIIQQSIKTECDSPTDFNPDDFLNYLPPSSLLSSSSSDNYATTDKILYHERNTPSPTNSSTSSISSSESNSSSPQNHHQQQQTRTTLITLDTPPISPQSIYTPAPQCQLTAARTTSPIILTPSPIIQPNPIKLLQNCGTIIPITTLPPMTMNLPLNNGGGGVTTSTTINQNDNIKIQKSKQKTIILSTKDFKNLMERYNKTPSNITGTNFLPKIVIKQKPKSSLVVLPKIAPQQQINLNLNKKLVTIPKLLPKNMNTINSAIIDEKTLKKQQRMIKNRKSACLSRMKKKDYVVSLESKIVVLEKENTDLKLENNALRSNIDALTQQQQCQCINNRKRKYADNQQTFHNNNNGTNNHNKMHNKFLMNSQLRKNTAVLLAMIFMVSINVGTINNYLNPNVDIPSTHPLNHLPINAEHFSGRGLLWFQNNNNDSMTHKNLQNTNIKNTSIKYEICPKSINQTENLRLASELRKWIGYNNYLNNSKIVTVGPYKLPSDYYLNENPELHRKLYKNIHKKNYFNRKKFSSNLNIKTTHNQHNSNHNLIDIYQPKLNDKYTKLFEEIRKRDDTFYVVSFNMEHILLPASAYNKSSRPKMSLMLPAAVNNDHLQHNNNGEITLMQIDCEVLNTTLIQLKEELIPKNLRRPVNNQKFHHNNSNNSSTFNNIPTTTSSNSKISNLNSTFDADMLHKNESRHNQPSNLPLNNDLNLTTNIVLSTLLPKLQQHQHNNEFIEFHKNHKPTNHFINNENMKKKFVFLP